MAAQRQQQHETIAASYERVSTRRQAADGYSLTAQRRTMLDFAAEQGWQLPEQLQFSDTDSGAKTTLPGLDAMLGAAFRREFQVLIVPDFDRFARNMAKAKALEDVLRKYGVRVIYQRVPVEDTPDGRLQANIMHSFSEYEREKILLRTMMGKREKARSGQVVGVLVAPYGYRMVHEAMPNGRQRTIGLEPDPLTAPIAKRILRDVQAQSSISTADQLNAEGVPGPGGRRWNDRMIRRMASDPLYAGVWIYGKYGNKQHLQLDGGDGIVVPIPALISQQEWTAVQEALNRRKITRRGRVAPELDPYLLRGMLECGHCHRALAVKINNGYRYYVCQCRQPANARRLGRAECTLPDVLAASLEDDLWRQLTAALADQQQFSRGLVAARQRFDTADQVRQDRIAAMDAEVRTQQSRLDKLTLSLADATNEAVSEALMRQMDVIGRQLLNAARERDQLAAMRPSGLSADEHAAIEAFAADVRAGMEDATPNDRRRIYSVMQLRGVVHADANGTLLGRKHRYRIEWTGIVELRDSRRSVVMARLLWTSRSKETPVISLVIPEAGEMAAA